MGGRASQETRLQKQPHSVLPQGLPHRPCGRTGNLHSYPQPGTGTSGNRSGISGPITEKSSASRGRRITRRPFPRASSPRCVLYGPVLLRDPAVPRRFLSAGDPLGFLHPGGGPDCRPTGVGLSVLGRRYSVPASPVAPLVRPAVFHPCTRPVVAYARVRRGRRAVIFSGSGTPLGAAAAMSGTCGGRTTSRTPHRSSRCHADARVVLR